MRRGGRLQTLPDHQPPVHSLNHGLRHPQGHIAAVTASRLVAPEFQHPWLVAENARYRIGAQLPDCAKFLDCEMALHNARARRGFGHAEVFVTTSRGAAVAFTLLPHRGGPLLEFAGPHTLA